MAAICSLPVCAQTRVMKVTMADGTTTTYKVAKVQEVRFEDRVMPTLQNQYALNEDAYDINAVTREINQGGSTFDVLDADAKPLFTVWASTAAMGKTMDLSEASADDIRLTAHTADGDFDFNNGALRVAFDKFGKNVTIDFAGEVGNDDWAIKYQGAFATTYAASQQISVTPQEGEMQAWALGTVLRMAPAATGENTRFVLAPAEGSTAEELTAGDCCVLLSLPATAITSGTLDLSEVGSYVLKYYQYAHEGDATTFTVKDDVVGGTVTYAETEDGRIYIKLDAQFGDGTTLAAEYYGEPTPTDNIDGLEPVSFVNQFTHYNAEGDISTQKTLTGVEYRVKSSKTNFYFMYEDADTGDERGSTVPLLILPESMMANGTYELKDAQEGFEFKFGAIQLAVGQYRNQVDNGTLTIEQDGEGNITVVLELVNTYTTDMGWQVSNGGTPEKISISYKGKLTAR